MTGMNNTLTALIFARDGSKGLPGKNIKLLAGIPLIGWAIEASVFPVLEYWIDVGRIEDLDRARAEYETVFGK